MKIDAHQHYWKLDRGDYDWLTSDMQTLYRDYEPQHLRAQLQEQGIDKTIVVQAAATLAETQYLLSLADSDDTIAGVVGWVDLADAQVEQQLEQLCKHPKFVGFRIMFQDMPDVRVVLEPEYIAAMQMVEKMDIPVDLLVTAEQLDVLCALMRHVPNLRGVIDHLAKPRIAEGIKQPWMSQMDELSQYPNIYCKLSGMITEADHSNWKQEDFHEYVQHVIACFGKDRILFGSDWPVCLLAGEYSDVLNILERSLPEGMTESDREKLYGNNAVTFYKLKL